jgi:predicted RNA-binding protein YlxR (DUF448 family)
MCIGCRKKRKKEEMLRFIQSSDGIGWMKKKRNVNGRSFYLCPDLTCFKIAKKKNRSIGSLGEIIHLVTFDTGLLQSMRDFT